MTSLPDRRDRVSRRTIAEVIDCAIAENKMGERLLYGFASFFITVGLGILIWGVRRQQLGFAVVGLVTSSLFWPALNSIRRTRKENLAIRLLEAALTRAKSADEAAKVLEDFFREVMHVELRKKSASTDPRAKEQSAGKPE